MPDIMETLIGIFILILFATQILPALGEATNQVGVSLLFGIVLIILSITMFISLFKR